jgi:hypothetical protein
LLQAGFPPSDLDYYTYIANEWKESAQALKESHNLPHCFHGPGGSTSVEGSSPVPFVPSTSMVMVAQPNP